MCNRPTAVRYNSIDSPPVIRFTYHDSGRPAPLEKGDHTIGGRCVRIDDEVGSTIFDYDDHGRLAYKKSQPFGVSDSYELNFQYRADGQLDKITYPKVDSGRRKIQYEYNKRGKIARIPSIVTNIEYD